MCCTAAARLQLAVARALNYLLVRLCKRPCIARRAAAVELPRGHRSSLSGCSAGYAASTASQDADPLPDTGRLLVDQGQAAGASNYANPLQGSASTAC